MAGVEGQDVLCECGIPSRLQISSTERNPGRRFYTCSKRTISNLCVIKINSDNNQCDFFAWVDNDMPYQMMLLRGLKADLTTMTEERDALLVKLREAASLLSSKNDEILEIKDHLEGLKESHDMYVEENGVLFEESGLLFMEIDTLKDEMKVLEENCALLKRSTKLLKIALGVGFVVTGFSVAFVSLRKT
ncbi:uncharacterized protein LOC126686774 [Mercurialis annua]|uniref:uncharacterized protein LOC126686774 n=1 Tax=Mercurialis annua TaxID=3986 RepID=UPI002160985C|nr:uncharacterized protein LOC126686774 [Mercurialis annua]